MARNMQPKLKRCRTLGIEPTALGINKSSNRNPGGTMRKKKSEYGIQLNEKQKAKFIYGVLEKPFRKYFELAEKRKGITGENLIAILESRLDNVVYRLGYTNTRAEARQFINHGHFMLNGKRVTVASILVKPGDVITLREKSASLEKFKNNLEINSTRIVPKWLEFDASKAEGKVIGYAKQEDIDFPLEVHLIVELYSK